MRSCVWFLYKANRKTGFPVEIEYRHPAAATEHASHLGQSFFGIGNMHQHALGPDRVERVIWKR